MKLVIREYLASLRERGELDAVLPDLLTELGFVVYSRPGRGTRQYGVDVGAVGKGRDGVRRVHLFSVKSGDLDRGEWNTASPQSLRPSLDEILDVYVTSRIPPEHSDLPIAICLCFGGAIDEQVRAEVTGYIRRNTTEKISFEEWNGDILAQVILDGILREELLAAPLRSHLRKAVAMVEEPDISMNHFERLLRALIATPGDRPAIRLSQARLINICLWIMFVWGREADDVEAPYRASERALLVVWHLLRTDVVRTGRAAEDASLVLSEMIELHFAIWEELFTKKILPFAATRHALSTAIHSHASIDINIKLFELVGRLALRGLWMVWQLSPGRQPVVLTDAVLAAHPSALAEINRILVERIDTLCNQLVEIVSNNRALLSPIGDWQAIDISLAFTLLATRERFHGAIDQWLEGLTSRIIFAYMSHGAYPTTSRSYWDLVEHPAERSEEYRRQSSEASILYPMLALWAAARGYQQVIDEISDFKAKALGDCTFQTWLPDEDSEANLYLGNGDHGAALTGIPVTEGTRDTLDFVIEEVKSNGHYDALSVIEFGHWPILLTACRSHRLPVPAHVWRDLLQAIKRSASTPATPGPGADTNAEDYSGPF
ncbi:hypothetical protein DBIPINDM_004161 [Mesorhizobium sp. AR02]|uniref:hypothetical protein n=1 Tax=Mesorhizobium sp. AR02 TaxID=2865837 RepID=UPI002160E8F2|nr:hypothetical protein [Mesorhizobium sp. AR02]UVK50960.1 hypothetical protein DBIPINDM_004161 [Mesorhizobium sp. AR02]